MSHIQNIRDERKKVSEAVCSYLKRDQDYLFWLKIDLGLEYLDNEMKLREPARSLALKNPLFWGWFINEWYRRDKELHESKPFFTPDAFQKYYQSYHRIRMVQVTPQTAVMEKLTALNY